MSHFTLTIKTDNAAFEEPAQEVARMLRELADRIDRDSELPDVLPLRDLNGNRVGQAETDGHHD
ncbi:MAG: hypothetical protein AWU57_600 [Marinobacter sp. T13-3]|nr:MAG: hypothetical protein AWU57_600 [Marinobacter sp. T13-3]